MLVNVLEIGLVGVLVRVRLAVVLMLVFVLDVCVLVSGVSVRVRLPVVGVLVSVGGLVDVIVSHGLILMAYLIATH